MNDIIDMSHIVKGSIHNIYIHIIHHAYYQIQSYIFSITYIPNIYDVYIMHNLFKILCYYIRYYTV